MEWIFLRGLVREKGHWAGFLEAFSNRFPTIQVSPLDIPGAGEFWKEKSPWSLEEAAGVIHSRLLEANSRPRYIFALSLGAMLASVLLRKWPREFQGAVFVNTSFRGFSPFWHRLQPAVYGKIFRALCTSSLLEREKIILEITSRDGLSREALALDWAEIQKNHPVSRANALRQIVSAARFRPNLAPPPVPLLLLNGAGDHLVSPSCSKAISQAWKAPLVIHPTAGHDLTLDEPLWVLDQVEKWLATSPMGQ